MKKLITLILALVFIAPAALLPQNNQAEIRQSKKCLESANLQDIQLAIDNGAPLSINDAFFYVIKELDGNEYADVFKLLIKNEADINGKYCKIRFCDTLVPPITAATSEYIQNAKANNQKYSGGGISFHIPHTPVSFGRTSGTITGGYISDTIDKLTLLFENNVVVAAERELSTDKR